MTFIFYPPYWLSSLSDFLFFYSSQTLILCVWIPGKSDLSTFSNAGIVSSEIQDHQFFSILVLGIYTPEVELEQELCWYNHYSEESH